MISKAVKNKNIFTTYIFPIYNLRTFQRFRDMRVKLTNVTKGTKTKIRFLNV